MQLWLWTLLFAFLLFPASSVWAQKLSSLPSPLKPKSEVAERWDDTKLVSGSYLLGVRVATNTSDDVVGTVMWLPASVAGGDVCLTVIGDGGHYVAQQTYTVAVDWPGGAAQVSYKSKYGTAPRSVDLLSADDALARLSLGECLDLRSKPRLLMANWGQEFPTPLVKFEILIRAPETEDISLFQRGVLSRCDRVNAPKAGYNVLCRGILGNDIINAQGAVNFEIIRAVTKTTVNPVSGELGAVREQRPSIRGTLQVQ